MKQVDGIDAALPHHVVLKHLQAHVVIAEYKVCTHGRASARAGALLRLAHTKSCELDPTRVAAAPRALRSARTAR